MLDSLQATPPETEVTPLGAIRDSAQARLALSAFVADDETEAALRGGLVNVAERAEIRRGTILHAIRHLAKEPTPRVLIVDITGVEDPLSELDRLAGVCTPDVTVLVIGDSSDIGFYRKLVRHVGVAEYLHKPVTRDHVSRMFVPHIVGITTDTNATRAGNVIAVCGARGGVGTTTIAVNLALQLSATTRGHVALLDLHLRHGTTALMLGVQAPGGLRVALEQPEVADALFLDRVCVDINERLRLVAADEELDSLPLPTPDGIRCVLDLLGRRFNYVVIDMPLPGTLAEMQALRSTRHLITVMTPDLASIRDIDRLRKLASSLGTGHTTVVLNRVGVKGGIGMSLIEQGLGAKPTISIPDLAKKLARAANLGKPALGECASFSKGIALLAQEISGTAASRSQPDRRSRFDRIFGR
jgi:pilus assembly protein CpaE